VSFEALNRWSKIFRTVDRQAVPDDSSCVPEAEGLCGTRI